MDPQILERLETSLNHHAPAENWQSAMVPAAMVVELLEACSGALRSNGARHEAQLLDGLRRGFLARRHNDRLRQEAAPAETPVPTATPKKAMGRRVPGFGRVSR
jgi:hypothetical protein